MSEVTKRLVIAGKEVEVSTGKLAFYAHGSIKLTMGGTTLLATVTVDEKESDLDYFPLSVEYIERMYASGIISSSRFKKREGHPSDEATIKAREVDHSIRSLFPKSFKRAVSVVLTVLSYDGINNPQSLTVLGTSLAVMQAGIPFAGPCSSIIVNINKAGEFALNLNVNELEDTVGEFIISGVDGRTLSFEGWGKEIKEEKMGDLLDFADKEIRKMNEQQKEFISQIKPTLDLQKKDYIDDSVNKLLLEIEEKYLKKIKEAMFSEDRNKEISALRDIILEKLTNDLEDASISEMDVVNAIDYISRKVLRNAVLQDSKRISGRELMEIRELKASVDEVPTVHGSALFSRGKTQSLSIVTLAPKSSELLIDDMEGESTKTFMHHYNFPPFSTGETGRYRYHPGRREIGHGAIGENALKYMIPSIDDFPYTIRVVSEILSSNGSTSMAATCASSLALMAAGVPLKEQVAGVGVGLITNEEDENDYKLLLDIEGVEDFFGDMDFKVCGTKNGITAIQYENKLKGVPINILKEAFDVAKKGRHQVLEVMDNVLSRSRKELADNAPKIETIQIKTEQIGELIGPGGKNIKELVEQSKQYGKTQADIDIDDDGTVRLSAVNEIQMSFLKNSISDMFEEAVVGKEYSGVVGKIMDFGAFIDVSKSISGLVHVSEITEKFTKNANDVLKKGQNVKVKVLKIDDKGRINFTMKGIEQPQVK